MTERLVKTKIVNYFCIRSKCYNIYLSAKREQLKVYNSYNYPDQKFDHSLLLCHSDGRKDTNNTLKCISKCTDLLIQNKHKTNRF